SLPGFEPNKTSYDIQLPIGTTELPTITVVQGDEYEKVTILQGGLNGTTRITVSAGNGNTTVYQLNFSVLQATDATLNMIYLDGEELEGFSPNVLEYAIELPQGTTELPVVTYTQHDEYQTVTTRSGGVNGDYKLIVRPQSGASQTYVIHFSVYKSSNTALQMIYLDGQPMPGFDSEVTDYQDTLDISTLPAVTYLAEPEQKVLMLLNDNVQTIKVTAESGATRVYTITFVVRKSESAFLKMIYLDGDSLKGFEPTKLTYSDLYLKGKTCPAISVDKEEGQQVTIMSPYAAGTAYVVVTAAAGGQNTYMLQLTDTSTTPIQPIEPEPPYEESEDTSLKNILIDGVGLEGFLSTQHTYELNLDPGASYPVVTFVKNVEKQSVVSGQTAQGVYNAYVTAENGNTSTYTVTVYYAPYTNAYLKNLSVEGMTLDFEPTTLTYTLSLDEGLSLPQVSYETNPGQTVMFNTVDANKQQLIVTAESGIQNTYVITYTRVKSANALLKDILLDGVSMADFKADKFEYIDTLAWRTQIVPMVNAIGQNVNQTITTYFSSVNNITRIYVLASDGVTSADYTIHFPVRKSSNVLLNDMYLETEYTVELNFNPNQTDYAIELPHTATMSPRLIFEKSEPEQSVTYIARPIGQANEITVTAENGDTRTYTVTFTRAALDKENILSAISIIETGQSLDLTDKTQRIFDVELPYGTRTMTLTYIKNYSEQTVLVQPGGIDKPTIVTVQSNQEGVADAIYTLNPHVATADPAVLTSIEVNNAAVPGFIPERFSYIVPITSTPIVRYTVAQGVMVNVLQQTNKHWQAEVSIGGRKNVYDVWYYYEEDVIPNGEFTDWTTAKYNNAPKPAGWNCVADAVESFKVVSTYHSGGEVSKSGTDAVKLLTEYSSPLGGVTPGMISLGTITGNLGVAGSSSFNINGGIRFRNSPDNFSMRYYSKKVKNNNLVQYSLTGLNGSQTIEWKDSEERSNYKEVTYDLSAINQAVGEPSTLNITLCSYYVTTGTISANATPEMYVDWIRLSYNHVLKSIAVNGKDAAKSGNAFTYETSDTEDRRLPQLTFVGEVADQAQQVVWSDETISGQYAVRTATIHNYAENGTDKTDYTLTVNRALSTINTLSNLYINGTPYADFDAETTEYKFDLKAGDLLPDVYPYPASNRQTITTVRSGNTITITVQPESGEAKVYKLIYTYKQSANTQLAGIDGIDNFAPTTYEYTYFGEALPAMNFVKAEDAQTVVMDNGLFTVTAENGAQQTYTVQLQKPQHTTSGQLSELELDGDLLAEFEPDKYDYEHVLPTMMAFVRKDAQDSVIYTRQPNKMTWRVIGSEEHTYTITAPTVKSSSTNLQGIYVNDVLIEGFAPQVKDYTIYSDSAMDLVALGENDAQTIQITRENNVYTIWVTAEDGTVGATPYTVTISQVVSADATLKSISLDGQALSEFRADSLQYTIVIPVGKYKEHEPLVPSIAFVASDPKAHVDVVTGGINETTYLVVTSSDGTRTNSYELTFTAEPSHNVQLSAIIVNGVMVEHFEPYRSYYSVQVQHTPVTMEWRSKDKFQTVQVTSEGNIYTLHVIAQDGVSTMDYTVEVYEQTLSNDATLSMIWLDGKPMENYRPDMNPDLYFNPGLNRYTINLPYGEDNLPDISATLKMEGQSMALRYVGQTAYLDVTAPDGVSKNTYTLIFKGVKSTNTDLKMIYLDGDSLANFTPNNRFYYITIPSGVRTLPEIFVVKGEQGQQVSEPAIQQEGKNQRATITVTAEDTETQSQYILFFAFQPSEADTLLMLYADGDSLEGFMPQRFNYNYELPIGTTAFPTISWEVADAMQVVTVDTLQQTAWMRLCQYVVTAESGHRNTYTVTYEIIRSAVDTLQMIYLNGDSLPSFRGDKNDYTIIMLTDATERPNIFYTEGDRYQAISMVDIPAESADHSLGKTQITVAAQNGQTRVYTLSFPLAYSSDTTLSMIAYNGTDISGFDEGIFSYNIQLEYGITQTPIITFVKNDPAQNVDITIVSTFEVQVTVLAEDKEHTGTYYLHFIEGKSSNALLQSINLNDTLMPGFVPEQFGYEFTVDSLKDVPEVTFQAAEVDQVITKDTTYTYQDALITAVEFICYVTAPDGETENAYSVLFHIKSNEPKRPEDSDNARLTYIKVKGQVISIAQGFDKDFNPDSLTYRMVYPI
ncbi:MAG: hypothetical protein MJZ55_02640, partial [Paludibacteraceae bacterium]|nr:hypothetical protein [Paludibacteraceae bacterium]